MTEKTIKPRTLITFFFVLVLVTMGVRSFYVSVLVPHREGAGTGMASMPEMATTPSTAPAAGTGSQQSGDLGPVPAALAGLQLTGVTQGDQAKAMVEELHGKALGAGLEAAWIGEYDQKQATLWVSRSLQKQDADALLKRMHDRIAEGKSPFTNPRTLSVGGLAVYALDGMGQSHFYFQMNKDIFWLAIGPTLATAGLDELVADAQKEASK